MEERGDSGFEVPPGAGVRDVLKGARESSLKSSIAQPAALPLDIGQRQPLAPRDDQVPANVAPVGREQCELAAQRNLHKPAGNGQRQAERRPLAEENHPDRLTRGDREHLLDRCPRSPKDADEGVAGTKKRLRPHTSRSRLPDCRTTRAGAARGIEV
jgi:hypothetical protein